MLDAILLAVEPIVVEAVALVIAGLLAWATAKLNAYLGVKTTLALRKVLDDALRNGALQADTEDPEAMAASIVAYVRKTIPDTLASLGSTDAGKLMGRARAAAQEHLNGVTFLRSTDL